MKFYIKNGGSEPPKDSHYYIVARNGVFLCKKNPVLETILPVENIPVLEFQREILDVKYPPVPRANVLEIISFFLRNYKRYRGESIVVIHFSPSKGYRIHAPDQRVERYILDYSPRDRFDGYLLVGSIHCHGNVIAYHSSEHEFSDNEDEVDFDGMHITIGNINSSVLTISCSVMVNGKRFMLNPLKYLEGIKEVKIPKIEIPLCRPEKGLKGNHQNESQEENPFGAKVPFSPYWAPMTGRKNWFKLAKMSEENRNGSGKGLLNSLIKRLKGKPINKETEKKRVEYLGNPFNPWIPFFFSIDLPDNQTLKNIEFPEEWLKRVKRYPLKERIKVYCSQLGGGYEIQQL